MLYILILIFESFRFKSSALYSAVIVFYAKSQIAIRLPFETGTVGKC